MTTYYSDLNIMYKTFTKKKEIMLYLYFIYNLYIFNHLYSIFINLKTISKWL